MLFILRDSWNLMTRNVTDVQLILSFFLVERLMEYSVFNALKLDETCGGYVCLSICLYIYIYRYRNQWGLYWKLLFIRNKNMLRFCLIHCCKKVTPLLLLYISCVLCAFWSWISEICTFSQKMKNRNWTSILFLQLRIHHDQFVWMFNLITI